MSVDKRLCAVSLSREEPVMVLAGYKDGVLYVTQSKTLARNLSQLKKELPKDLEARKKAGFIVLVDELLSVFSRHGRRVRLQDIGQDGRPILISALEIYRNLRALQAINLPQGDSGSFDIPDSVVDERRDASGKAQYNIDWESLQSKHVALLLLIHAASSDNIYDQSITKTLFKIISTNKQGEDEKRAVSRMAGIFKSVDLATNIKRNEEKQELNDFGIPIYRARDK